MGTIFHDPNKALVAEAGEPEKQGLTNPRSKSGSFASSPLFSRSRVQNGNYVRAYSCASDDDLITAAQRGDQQAFVELCSRYSYLAKKKILRIVRNQADAEDALQDTLLRAYTNLTSFRRSCKFATWLTTIGVNSALMMMRKRKVRGEIYASGTSPEGDILQLQEPTDRSLGPEGIYLKQQAILLLRREVEKLKPNLRSIVYQYYGSECSLEEAANALEITVAAAKTRLLRGRVRLRSSLARYGISRSHH